MKLKERIKKAKQDYKKNKPEYDKNPKRAAYILSMRYGIYQSQASKIVGLN